MIQIRKATIKDLEQLLQLFDAYRVFYGKNSEQEESRKFLWDRFTNNDSVIFVADNGVNRLTGFTQLYPLFSSVQMKRLWLLNDLFVDPAYRGQGVSIALINEAKKLCRSTGACGMYLETAKTNLIGNQLYPKTGFVLNDAHNFYEWDVN